MLSRFIHSAPLPIGIDLGASGAKMVQLRWSRGGLALIAALRVESDPDAASAEEAFASVVAGIGRRLDAGRFVGRRCVLSLPDSMISVRSVRMPRMSDEDTDSAVRLDGAERLGLTEAPAEISWLRAGEVRQGEDIRDEVILVGADRKRVEWIVDSLAGVGLTPLEVEPAFVSAARILGRQYRRQSDQKHVRLVVDVGWRSTGITALRGDKVAFYKQLEWGGERLDMAAADALGLAPGTVAEIRRQRFQGGIGESAIDPRVERAVFDAVRPMLGELAHEVTLCLRYYLVTFRGDKPQCVLVVGGEADEPRLAEAIQESTGIEARVARPLEGMDLSTAALGGGDRRGSMAQWAVAAGLSLRHEPRPRRKDLLELEAPAAEPKAESEPSGGRREAA